MEREAEVGARSRGSSPVFFHACLGQWCCRCNPPGLFETRWLGATLGTERDAWFFCLVQLSPFRSRRCSADEGWENRGSGLGNDATWRRPGLGPAEVPLSTCTDAFKVCGDANNDLTDAPVPRPASSGFGPCPHRRYRSWSCGRQSRTARYNLESPSRRKKVKVKKIGQLLVWERRERGSCRGSPGAETPLPEARRPPRLGRAKHMPKARRGEGAAARGAGTTGPQPASADSPSLLIGPLPLSHVLEKASTRGLGPLSEYLRPPRCPPQSSHDIGGSYDGGARRCRVRTAGPVSGYPANGGASIGHLPHLVRERAGVGRRAWGGRRHVICIPEEAGEVGEGREVTRARDAATPCPHVSRGGGGGQVAELRSTMMEPWWHESLYLPGGAGVALLYPPGLRLSLHLGIPFFILGVIATLSLSFLPLSPIITNPFDPSYLGPASHLTQVQTI